jgi:hypothetical protein
MLKASQPAELLALFFTHEARSDDEIHLRNALALSIDSAALNNVVFQSAGEPTGALLPNWLSGYGFVYPAGSVATRPRAPHPVAWTLSCDSSDPAARIAADRILLNAKDAGITLQIVNSDNADIRLVKVALPSADSDTALDELARGFQLPAPAFATVSVNSLYSAETALLRIRRVIPIVYLRSAVAFRSNVRGLKLLPDGSWQLDNVWLSAETP